MKSPWDYFKWSKPIYDLAGHKAYVQSLHDAYPLNTHQKSDDWTWHTLSAISDGKVPYQVLLPLKKAIESIYDNDQIYRVYCTLLEDRNYLELQQHQLSDERVNSATATIVRYFKQLLHYLPPSVFTEEKPNLSVPLHTFIKYQDAVTALIHTFNSATYGDNPTFPDLQEKLMSNVLEISGINRENPGTKKLITPDEYNGDPSDFLRDTPFYDFFQTPIPFAITTQWDRHGICIAPSGHGKSQLAQAFIAQRLSEPNPIGFFFVDPHGDSFDTVAARVDPSRLVLVDPDDPQHRPSLNFLDFSKGTEPQIRQTFEYLMSSLSGGLSEKQGAIVPYLLKLLRQIPNASLESLRLVVDEKCK